MNDALKNPILVLLAGILAIWLVFKLLKVFVGLFWIVILAFVVLFVVNPGFRITVQRFFANIFGTNN